MSHYCCKKCGQRYDDCKCSGVAIGNTRSDPATNAPLSGADEREAFEALVDTLIDAADRGHVRDEDGAKAVVMAAFEVARARYAAPVATTEAVAWQYKVPCSDVWHESSEVDALIRKNMGYDTRALAVIPPTTPDADKQRDGDIEPSARPAALAKWLNTPEGQEFRRQHDAHLGLPPITPDADGGDSQVTRQQVP